MKHPHRFHPLNRCQGSSFAEFSLLTTYRPWKELIYAFPEKVFEREFNAWGRQAWRPWRAARRVLAGLRRTGKKKPLTDKRSGVFGLKAWQ
ncbi:hypothetical protein QVG61_11605 [Thiohalobacter sp. IOR34]|uniref:hypothetical protein n=1 Tax=Thiohalobacter sp. IOR34 TaxID=3057176 RepID=UPI0025B0961A|nr:hypothetical protein [Thiohalobacter sp. IOR34]WJW75128.1 hypothetical protein QVG61_11605 [Thiohalobacter sp. IOR34]